MDQNLNLTQQAMAERLKREYLFSLNLWSRLWRPDAAVSTTAEHPVVQQASERTYQAPLWSFRLACLYQRTHLLNEHHPNHQCFQQIILNRVVFYVGVVDALGEVVRRKERCWHNTLYLFEEYVSDYFVIDTYELGFGGATLKGHVKISIRDLLRDHKDKEFDLAKCSAGGHGELVLKIRSRQRVSSGDELPLVATRLAAETATGASIMQPEQPCEQEPAATSTTTTAVGADELQSEQTSAAESVLLTEETFVSALEDSSSAPASRLHWSEARDVILHEDEWECNL